MDLQAARDVLAALEHHGVEYVLVGGLALGVHGLIRATEDIDLFVNPSSENIERIRAALHEVFQDPSIDEIRSEDLAGEYPVIRYLPPGTAFVIDLMGRVGEAFHYADLESERRSIEGVSITVATPRMLYRMKKDTLRPIDRADAEALRRRFGLSREDQ